MSSFFSNNIWYSIGWQDGKDSINTMQGSGAGLQTAASGYSYGAAFLSPTDSGPPNQSDGKQWQFFPNPANQSQYLIRLKAQPVVDSFLAVRFEGLFPDACGGHCTQTGITVSNHTDDSVVWNILPSGDGQTSFLSPVSNGTAWLIRVDDGTGGGVSGSYMNLGPVSTNTSQTKFIFSSVSAINDKTYSTIPPGFSASSTSTSTSLVSIPSSTSIPTAPVAQLSNAPPSSSANIGAAVGGAIGGFAVVVLAILGFLLLRRKRKPSPEKHDSAPPYEAVLAGPDKAIDRKEAEQDSMPTLYEAPSDHAIYQAPQSKDEGLAGGTTNPSNSTSVFELAGEGMNQESGRRWRLLR